MKFSDVIGNPSAQERIRQMIDSDRFPHALLIHGLPGVPKLTLARVAAQYLQCTNRTGGEPCGQCPSCLQHQSFNHADTYYSYPIVKIGENPTSNDFINEWKEFLSENEVEDFQKWTKYLSKENAQPIIYQSESDRIVRDLSLAAYTSKYKVLILWLPEKMNESCANKLLKLIEEPHADTKFIFVSNDAKSILPTIFSRTQRVELKRPATEDITAYICRKFNADPESARIAATAADGDIAQAERNMELDSETAQFHQDFMQLMRMAYVRNLKELKAWSEHIADYKREKARRFLNYASRMVRENFIYNLHNPSLNYQTRDEQQFSVKFAPFINEYNVERLIAEFTRAEKDIRMNGNIKLVLFDMAIKITILIKV
ncbi:MAG: DNA polymerase III subunit delta [Bacteroidales bacterium]|nr:DNA polymerase III subunit delta [Bacteroidales bacterium]